MTESLVFWLASLVPLCGDCHFFNLKSIDDYYKKMGMKRKISRTKARRARRRKIKKKFSREITGKKRWQRGNIPYNC